MSTTSFLPKKIGPVEVLEKINPNVYRLKLPSHVRTAVVFNVKHLIPFTDDDVVLNSRSNFLSAGENDVDQAALDFLDRFDRVQVRKRASTGSI